MKKKIIAIVALLLLVCAPLVSDACTGTIYVSHCTIHLFHRDWEDNCKSLGYTLDDMDIHYFFCDPF